MTIEWGGPVGIIDVEGVDRIENHRLRKAPGLYLWTVPIQSSYLIHYVGESSTALQTRNSANRRWMYTDGKVVDIDLFKQGIVKELPEHALSPEEKRNSITEQLKCYRMFLARVEEGDAVRKCIEHALITTLHKAAGMIYEFLSNSQIRRPPLPPFRVEMRSSANFLGLGKSLDC